MRVTLSALTFDPLGVVALAALPGQQFGETRRRMNRVATLDGGAAFNDFGVSEADRSIALKWRTTGHAQQAAIGRLVELYAQVHCSTPKGFFRVALELYTPGAAESSLSLLVVSRLA